MMDAVDRRYYAVRQNLCRHVGSFHGMHKFWLTGRWDAWLDDVRLICEMAICRDHKLVFPWDGLLTTQLFNSTSCGFARTRDGLFDVELTLTHLFDELNRVVAVERVTA